MEQSSSQRFIQSSQYDAMNDLLFQQFGFQVLANNIRKEDTDTHPILVQCVLRESDVEIWGGFRVRAFIVKLDFLKTHNQPEMCLAILLKNKFTPDVKRLGAPFQLKAYHLQWIQNVLDEDVDGMPVRNSKEIPFIAMYDAAKLSEAGTLTNNLPWKGSEVTTLLETEGEANAVEEMETPGAGHNQSTVREKSHDLSPADTSQACQEVSINTIDMNKLELEKFPTDLKDENKRERVKGQNEEALGDVSPEDGDVGQTTDEPENCESSEDLDNIWSTDVDKRLSAELSTKKGNMEMNHPGHQFSANAAITDMSEAAAEPTETPCSDTGGASSPDADKSCHQKAEPNDDEELLPGTQSKQKSTAFKKAPLKKNKLQCEEKLTTERNPTLHAELHSKKKEAKTLKRKKKTEKATKKFYNCEDCGISFTLKNEYSVHVRIHKEDAKKQRFQCPLCGTQFTQRKDLTHHEKSEHPGATPYVCEVCHNGFKSLVSLKNHIRKCHRAVPFSCEECNKVFKTSGGLNAHKKRRHLGIWNHQCDTCSKKFFGKYEYELHLVTHTNLRNFKCEVCGKAYKAKASLREHMISHSGKKPHLCNFCGKGFGRRQHLMEHMVVHTKKNDFLCDYCGKSFSNKTNLYVHRRQHTGVHPHVCTICWQGFHRQRGLAKHMEKIHSNVETEPSAS